MSKAEFFPASDAILPLDLAPRALGVAEAPPSPDQAEVLVLSKPRRGFSRQELARFSETVEGAVNGQFPKARYLLLDFQTPAPDIGFASAEFNRLAASIESLVS